MPLTVPGIDCAWGAKPYDAVKRAGQKFVMRYISHDPSKDLGVVEKNEWFKRGISVGVVFEATGGGAMGGWHAGVADARYAEARVQALGLSGIPVYFAVDFDAQGAQLATVTGYLQGAVSVLGRSRVGVYGGYGVIAYTSDRGVCAYYWQTYAWSGGKVHPKAHILQFQNGVRISGLACDLNRGRSDIPFGVRGPVAPPKPDPRARKRRIWASHLADAQKKAAALAARIRLLTHLTKGH